MEIGKRNSRLKFTGRKKNDSNNDRNVEVKEQESPTHIKPIFKNSNETLPHSSSVDGSTHCFVSLQHIPKTPLLHFKSVFYCPVSTAQRTNI